VEQPDGRRVLLAPTRPIADFVAQTYRFDEVRIVPVTASGSAETAGIGCPEVAGGSKRVRSR
jgi:hypothetical protein